MVFFLQALLWFVQILVFIMNNTVLLPQQYVYMDSLFSKDIHVILLIGAQVSILTDISGPKKNYETDQLFRSQELCNFSLNSLHHPLSYFSFFSDALGLMIFWAP